MACALQTEEGKAILPLELIESTDELARRNFGMNQLDAMSEVALEGAECDNDMLKHAEPTDVKLAEESLDSVAAGFGWFVTPKKREIHYI